MITLAFVAVIIVALSAYIISNQASSQLCMGCFYQEPSTSSTQTTSVLTNPNNMINVTGLGLCSSNCIYPSPYAYATVNINAVVPISTLAVYVNNTYDSTPIRNPVTTTGFGNTMVPYAYLFKGSVPSQFIPAVKGATYFFKFVATFQDGSTATATASTVAD